MVKDARTHEKMVVVDYCNNIEQFPIECSYKKRQALSLRLITVVNELARSVNQERLKCENACRQWFDL